MRCLAVVACPAVYAELRRPRSAGGSVCAPVDLAGRVESAVDTTRGVFTDDVTAAAILVYAWAACVSKGIIAAGQRTFEGGRDMGPLSGLGVPLCL